MDEDMSHRDNVAENINMEKDVAPRHIVEALGAKRRQLDKEIEDFKAQKEREYNEYEQRLRKEELNEDRGELSQLGEEDEAESSGHKKRAPSPKDRGTEDNYMNGNSIRRDSKNPRTARQAPTDAFGGSPGPPITHERHEGKREKEGVFTPEFLPLIDSQSKGHVQKSQESPSPPRPSEGSSRPIISNLSSSATDRPPSPLPSFLKLSVPHAQLSSSAPPYEDASHIHHRSDSAASNISVASLRSSMKDPRQQKSPKRVLFSLGDDVVSPSTSPIMARKPMIGGIVEGRGRDFETVFEWGKKGKGKKKTRRKERSSSADSERGRGRQSRDAAEDGGVSGETGFLSLADGWTKTIPTSTSQSATPSLLTAATSENFEKVEKTGNDDLFAFDEDLDSAIPKDPPSNSSTTGSMFDDDDDDRPRGSITGTSPHAGSLPIEIKWPGRRDTGG
ncbi:MAG: hypothetical protein Q9164_001515 [Protoblastenia rupestris]